ncbi:hypothetical protein CGRA01v4_11855 [Colletotrichum graminicola]|nr:hypothetical protein CGRA01v4_11855 [Colletotrichum graminicola]
MLPSSSVTPPDCIAHTATTGVGPAATLLRWHLTPSTSPTLSIPHALLRSSLFCVSLSFHTPTTYIIIIITSTHPSNILNQGTNTCDTHTPAEKDLGHIRPARQLSRLPYLSVYDIVCRSPGNASIPDPFITEVTSSNSTRDKPLEQTTFPSTAKQLPPPSQSHTHTPSYK